MYTNKNMKGQALLFVVVAMTIAMALGISTSVRSLSSVSRTTSTDTSSRVRAAAEGGIERMLVLAPSLLDAGISSYCPAAGGTIVGTACEISFSGGDASTDPIRAKASVTVSRLRSNGSNNSYVFTTEQDTVSQVNLSTISSKDMRICWNGNSDLYYIFYATSGVLREGFNGGDLSYEHVNFTDTISEGTFEHCSDWFKSAPSGGILRVRSIGGTSDVAVFLDPRISGDSFPQQGHTIESVGSLEQNGTLLIKKKITVHKSYPFLPAVFDFGLYSGNGWAY